MDNPLTPFLLQGAMVLDGGLATELESQGADLSGGLWSARWLVEGPERIAEVHRSYLEAGADCIVSASYQATIPGLVATGVRPAEAERLLRFSVALACGARDRFWNDPRNRMGRLRPLVAASVGPYGAYRADGSEYTGQYDIGEKELIAFHERRLEILADSGADLLACETIPAQSEARALAALLGQHPETWAWVSFCCRDGEHLADGSRLTDSLPCLTKLPNVVALGVNCTAPRFVPSLLESARKVTKGPLVAYPNSGERYEPESGDWDSSGTVEDWVESTLSWRNEGLQMIGGCCRTTPEDIRRLRLVLDSNSSSEC